jgi:hypothetical protein
MIRNVVSGLNICSLAILTHFNICMHVCMYVCIHTHINIAPGMYAELPNGLQFDEARSEGEM